MAHKCDRCRYKGEHQEMMFRPMGVCNRANDLAEAVKNYNAEKCPYKKTNEDVVRNMTSEELADFIGVVARNGWTRWVLTSPKEWLQQPAEGGA